VMLIAGGSGNNKGALLGAFLIWAMWSGTQFLTGYLPVELTARAGALRVLLVGVLLQVILLTRPQGLLPERPPPPIPANGMEPPRHRI
jgi:branched-chain amino acid transport system permease protein